MTDKSRRGRSRAAASTTDSDATQGDGRPALSVEASVRESLEGVTSEAPEHAALVALALTLARKLDDGAGMATAAVGKELRSTLDQIFKVRGAGDDDGLDDFVNGLGLPAPLGYSALS